MALYDCQLAKNQSVIVAQFGHERDSRAAGYRFGRWVLSAYGLENCQNLLVSKVYNPIYNSKIYCDD